MKRYFAMLLIFSFSFVNSTYAAVYVLNQFTWPTSVDSGENIHWWWSTKYNDQLDDAIMTWNNYWDVNISKDTFYTLEDLTIRDIYTARSITGEWWPSDHPDSPENYDTISLNTRVLDWYSDSRVENCITHEFWHALWLAHSTSWNIMRSSNTTQTWLWTHDEDSYDFFWN